MKKLFTSLSLFFAISLSSSVNAQGWPKDYGGVMLQGFYWDSFSDSQWSYLEEQADDISKYFSLVWIPQSGNCNSTYNQMGYMPVYYFDHNSSFGTEAQLRSMIKAYNDRGTGIIADVVINHRNNLGVGGSWVDYPAETYKGETYQMLSTDIVKNDDGNKTLDWATKNGYSLSDNNDTGEGWDGCRDLDHKSENVNKVIKAYLDYLINDLGYTGFRYDMVKGYSASFTADYNTAAKPQFSVGEYWDSSSNIKKWIDGTKVNDVPASGAFDFQFRYRVRDAAASNDWTKLAGNTNDQAGYPLIYQEGYSQYAITFVENHDTQYRSASEPLDPLKGDTLAANAYMLAMPGTPCVFYKHWLTQKKALKLMISARQQAGITNTSSYEVSKKYSTAYAVTVNGTKGKLICVVGSNSQTFDCPEGFTEILSGKAYRYLIEDKALEGWNDVVTRIEAEEDKSDFKPYSATVYVKADFNPVYFYIWDSNNNTQLNGNWPGKRIDNVEACKTVIDGETWYFQTVEIPSADYYFNFIVNQGNNKPQTSDIAHLTSDKYFVATISGSKITYTDVTSDHTTGIGSVPADQLPSVANIYTIDGRMIRKGAEIGKAFSELPKGIYIINGKTVLVGISYDK